MILLRLNYINIDNIGKSDIILNPIVLKVQLIGGVQEISTFIDSIDSKSIKSMLYKCLLSILNRFLLILIDIF